MTDYTDIVVGAGSSGAALAARLSEDPARQVLLLEAGPDYMTLDSLPPDLRRGTYPSFVTDDWGYTATVARDRVIPLPRGKLTGGSSAVNTCIAFRPDPLDFQDWVARGNDLWSWERVLPYFNRLEDDRDFSGEYHGRGGPIPIRRYTRNELVPLQRAMLEVCRGRGYEVVDDHNKPSVTGVGVMPTNAIDGKRISTAIGYLTEARRRPNLTVQAQTTVNRVVFEGGKAVGVEVFPTAGGTGTTTLRAGNVVLSAGSIGSPAILWRSGVGPAAALSRLGVKTVVDSPGVGSNLSDHPIVGVSLAPKPGVCDMVNPVCQVILKYTASGSEDFNDMQLYMFSQIDITTFAKEIQQVVDGTMVFMVPASLQTPRARGKVALTSADPTRPPAVELNSGGDPEDRRRLLDGIRLAWSVANSPEVSEFAERIVFLDQQTVDSDSALTEWLYGSLNTTQHPCGTVKMGPESDPESVVDQRCRVRGVENLRVVDASIMPSIVRSNPNLTCIMFGERLADLIKEDS